jgi:hypothetical protein
MNSKSLKLKSLALMLSLVGATPLTALATPPSSSPYALDPQSVYVQDATSDGIANLNMVLCIMDAMRPADMVNKGDYIALIDKNKCDTKSQSSASNSTSGASGATSTPDYMTAVVNATRASNTDPMLAKIWISMTEQGQAVDIYVHLSATQSPTDAPPYGQVRVDYIGKSSGNTQFNGFIDANGANVSYLETGANSSNNALALTATSTTAASGTMTAQDYSTQPPTPVTFNFAYDSSEANYPAGVFRRYDGTHDVCFDRSKASAQKSVWGYGTYNANDGTRVDQANPGFPITVAYNNSSYYGFASYWGINFQGLDLNSLPDGQVVGAVITDQRPGNTTTYNLAKNGGKLTKWTQNQETLTAMDGVPFSFSGDLTNQTSNSAVTGFNNWQMQWNNASSTFTVIGTQTCGNNGCVLTAISPVATVTGTIFDTAPISGWSNSFGGNINIPPTGSAHTSADNVYYYTQSDVVPGDSSAPTALYCLSQCPTATSVSQFATSGPCTAFTTTCSPYGNGTASQWNSASSTANTVSYSFGTGGLTEGNTSTAIEFTDPLLFMSSQQFQGGVMTGKLFTAALSNADCPAGAPGTMVCEPSNPATYYTWQTGPNQWNQETWLTKVSDSSVVHFNPPENIPYTVPGGAEYGTWANKQILLQFNGFGNLNGIPGDCVNPTDNSKVDCSTPGSRYVSAFSLPDGATMTLPSSGTPLVVKSLNAELRLNKVDCSMTSLAQPSTPLPLPSASGVHDPSLSTDADYIGVEPTVTTAPKVIDGVVQ